MVSDLWMWERTSVEGGSERPRSGEQHDGSPEALEPDRASGPKSSAYRGGAGGRHARVATPTPPKEELPREPGQPRERLTP